MAAEVVIFFNAELAREFEFRRKRGGHLFSKMRLLSAQLDAYFADGLWLHNPPHANPLAPPPVPGPTPPQGVQPVHPGDANQNLVVPPALILHSLSAAG